jgi:hypothetical protein
LQPEGAGRLADQIDSEIRYELFDEDRKNQLTPGLTILQSSLSLRAPKNQSKVLKYWATGPALTGLFLWDASRDFPAITGPGVARRISAQFAVSSFLTIFKKRGSRRSAPAFRAQRQRALS